MRNLIILGLLVMFLVSVQFAAAQTVDEIIDKYILARGGLDKLTGIKSIYMEGSREMMGNETMVKVIKEQGKLSRTEFEMGGSNGFTLVTEKEAWSYFPMRSQTPEKMPDEAATAMQTELDIAGPLVNYVAKGYLAELLGKDTLEGSPAYKIKLTSKAGVSSTYWIDASSYLLVRSTGTGSFMRGRRRNRDGEQAPQQPAADRGVPYTIYENYKAVDGILFPHSIEMKTPGGEGRGAGGTTFDKIELNKPVDVKLYKPE
jgi:hypothetical protein